MTVWFCRRSERALLCHPFCPLGCIGLMCADHIQSLESFTAASVLSFQRQSVYLFWGLSPFRKVRTNHSVLHSSPFSSTLEQQFITIPSNYCFLIDLSLDKCQTAARGDPLFVLYAQVQIPASVAYLQVLHTYLRNVPHLVPVPRIAMYGMSRFCGSGSRCWGTFMKLHLSQPRLH